MGLVVIAGMPEGAVTAAWASSCAGQPVKVIGVAPELIGVELPVTTANGTSGALLHDASGQADAGSNVYLLLAARSTIHELVSRHMQLLAGKPVLLAPGGVGLVEEIEEVFARSNLPSPIMGHLPGFPVLGGFDGPDLRIRAIKRRLPVGASTTQIAQHLCDTVRSWIPEVVAATLAETSLSITNNYMHPPIVLVNAARIERGEPFRFYREGLSEGAIRLVEAIDSERVNVLDALGLPKLTLVDSMSRYYGDQGMVGDNIGELLRSFPAFERSNGPTTLTHRYLTEDVPNGLAPLEALGSAVAIPTPVTSAVVTAAERLVGVDLRRTAPTDANRLLLRQGYLVSNQR